MTKNRLPRPCPPQQPCHRTKKQRTINQTKKNPCFTAVSLATSRILPLVIGLAIVLHTSHGLSKKHIAFEKNGYRIRVLSDPTINDWPKHRFYSYKKLIWISGKSNLALDIKKANGFYLKAQWVDAQTILEKIKKNAPQFFPARYNLGMVYYQQLKYQKALREFQYSSRLIPYWSKIYIRQGACFAKMAQKNDAIDSYRLALKKNKRDVEAIVALGDLYFREKSYYRANLYYKYAVKVDPDYLDARTGLAKILFAYQKYHDAVTIFKSLDYKKYSQNKNYNKALHFYFGESLYKIKRYGAAAKQYRELLKYPESPFFLTHAKELIQFKLNLAEKFAAYSP